MDGTNRLARGFALAAIGWAALGLVVGLFLAVELVAPLGGPPFARVRPLHAWFALYGFAGNALMAASIVSTRRLVGAPASGRLGWLALIGWQVAVAAGISVALGATQARALSEVEWSIDLALLAAWLAHAGALGTMIGRRTVSRLPVPVWFYLAGAAGFAVVQAISAACRPLGPLASEALSHGALDALVGALCAGAAPTFLVTLPALGVAYHVAGAPVSSRAMAIAQLWATVFLTGFTGAASLAATAAPDWAVSAAVAAVVALTAPALCGVANLALTARGRPPDDPSARVWGAALAFYAVAVAIDALRALVARGGLFGFTDVALDHLTWLGWYGLAAAAALSFVAGQVGGPPRRAVIGAHLYLATVGTLTFVASMWVAGATQGLMWRAETLSGLRYGFAEATAALRLPYLGRAAGGALYAAGVALLAWHVALALHGRAPAPAPPASDDGPRWPAARCLGAGPVWLAGAVFGLALAGALANRLAAPALLGLAALLALAGVAAASIDRSGGYHARLETSGTAMTALLAGCAALGFGALLVPAALASPAARALGPLASAGQAIYRREGCDACHTQMVRPFLWEVARHGEVSSADAQPSGGSLWGRRRHGPDLARVGGRRSLAELHRALVEPAAAAAGARMPSYLALAARRLALPSAAQADAARIAAALDGVAADRELVALIAYLEALGGPPEPAR